MYFQAGTIQNPEKDGLPEDLHVRCSEKKRNGGFLLPGGQRDPGSHSVLRGNGMSNKKRRRINWNQARNMDVDAWRERQIQMRLTAYLEQRERDFLRDHAEDTDDQLIACVRQRARELHRMPHPLELPGGEYLQQRLGDWRMLARRLGYPPVGKTRGEIVRQNLKEQIAEQFARERRALKAKNQQEKAERQKQEELHITTDNKVASALMGRVQVK